MFTKQEIIARRQAEIVDAKAQGQPVPEAGMNLAIIILGSSLYKQKLRCGHDYASHPLHVAGESTRSYDKQIIGILHDVIEDSDWELDDLKLCGFSDRIVDGVDGVTKRPGEKYFDFIERCSQNPDSVDIKIDDLEHNSRQTRDPALLTFKTIEKQNIYKISYQYLIALKKGHIKPGEKTTDFVAKKPWLNTDPDLIANNSSHKMPPPPSLKPDFNP